ncbi:unnamed protein product [Somion occarium]|uniref:Hydrophobin n=1 Tax=Somion occarium TaxID=3059160 RepID=A0ABP1DUW6_9APHY
MFTRILFPALFLTSFVAAAPGKTPPILPPGQCNTGNVQCCNTVESADSESGSALLGLLGIVLNVPANVLLGINCSPITVIGGGVGSSCSANPVCCENNSVGGLINIGCIPINLSL